MPLMLFQEKFNCGGYILFGNVLHTAKDTGEGGGTYY